MGTLEKNVRVMQMEKKLIALQSFLLVLLGIAIAALAVTVYWVFQGEQKHSPYTNAQFVRAQMGEIKA